MNLIDDALKLADNLRNMAANLDFSDETKFIGKFLPITVRIHLFKQNTKLRIKLIIYFKLKKLEMVVSRSQNNDHKSQYEELSSDIKNQRNRIYWQDLEDYCKQA